MHPSLYVAIPMGVLLAGILGFGLGPVVMNHFRTQRLMANGTPAVAEVISLTDSGNRINHQPVANVRMSVQPAGGAPFEATSQTVVSGINSPIYQPGKRISVKFDAGRPDRVVILGPAP